MCNLFVNADPRLWENQTRSIRMDGMVTSVRLETMFWMVLDEIAQKEDMNVPQLLHQLYTESLDAGHDVGNFTSFLRVCCLRFIDLRLKGLLPSSPGATALSAEAILRGEAERRGHETSAPGLSKKTH